MSIIGDMELSASVVEIEVKLRATTQEEAVERLGSLPPTLQSERHFEDNEIYDTPESSLRQAGRMLRLRLAEGKGILTLKEKIKTDLRAKVRKEIETPLDSPDAMREILDKLGLVKVYRYQKYRCYYTWADPKTKATLSISLDDTPIGVFIELEGPKQAIDRAALKMSYTADDYILDDYRTLHQAHLLEQGQATGDMVFPDGRGE